MTAFLLTVGAFDLFAVVGCRVGRLGQAYLDGYNCNNEEELQRVCGVRLR